MTVFFKAERRDTKTLAALKQVEIKAEDDLEDFMVEIDILEKCRHRNVVGLHETYYHGGKLWVSIGNFIDFLWFNHLNVYKINVYAVSTLVDSFLTL